MFHKELNGEDLHAPTNYLVENDTGSDIPILKVITFDGVGTFPSIRIAVGSVDTYRGVTMQDFPIAATGYITSLGFMIGVNTSPWAEGTSLYCDASGNLVTTPAGPLVATVYKQDAVNGWLYIEGAQAAGGGGGSGDVVGPPSSTDTAIPSWNGTSGKLLNNNLTLMQPGGAITGQGFIYDRQIINNVTVPNNYTMISNDMELVSGDVTLLGSAEIILL